ncbi:glycosyltransferase family 4 protein [Deinococcus peraridilitoris]|uniref:glycosyltransferase family 4 protein n=1 Tax=Deinococcus peraridilitoris TaxID=432329 RepID=UPI0012F9C372|nr:glycosyltransferase family 1 protein [Deinococcus peraridilitoris]
MIIVAPRFFPGRTYGAETYLYSLLAELEQLDSDVEVVIVVNEDAAAPIRARFPRLKVVTVKVPRVNFAVYLWEQMVLPRLLRQLGPHVLFFPFNIMPNVSWPSVLMVHDMVNDYYSREHPKFKPLLFRSRRRAIHASIARASMIVTPTVAVADEIRMLMPRLSVPVVSIHEASFPAVADERRPVQLAEGVKYFVLQSGHHAPHKNLALGIQAMAILKAKQTDEYEKTYLVMTAERHDIGDLEELTRNLGVEEHVVFLGRVSSEELEWLVRNASALGFPSQYEGFGLGVAEGIDRGKVVLAADTPVFREVSHGRAYLFNPRDAEEYARLIADAAMQRLPILNIQAERHKNWTWRDHVHQLMLVLETVVPQGDLK